MPGIKYKGTDGQWHLLNNVMVTPINVVQTTGTSSADVMSQSAVTEAVNDINETLSNYYDKDNIDTLVGSGFTSSSITDVIIENEEIASAALNDLDERKLDASAYTPSVDLWVSGTGENAIVQKDGGNTASGKLSVAMGSGTTASGDYSVAEGISTVASGNYSHAEGYGATASGSSSHAEGGYAKANGSTSHAEGNGAIANGNFSHAEGNYTKANGGFSHAEGGDTIAGGDFSHAEGHFTTAKNVAEHSSGQYNVSYSASTTFGDSGNTLFSVGNGTEDYLRHNAFEIRQNGDIYISSGGTNIKLQDNIGKVETMNRRTRTNFTSKGLEWFKTTLKSAIADKSLEKYGLKVGDYYTTTHNGKTYNYVIAGLNTMRGTSTPYRLDYDHVGIIVDTNDTHAWNVSGNTYQSQNSYSTGGTWTTGSSAAGYANSDLHYYLTTTVLNNVKDDLGDSNLKAHSKLYSTAVNTSGYNRFGSPGGCSSSWAWYTNQKICALSEIQVYGSIVWSSSGYDTGEACRQLDVFRVYNMNEIFEGRYPWLRDVASSSGACYVSSRGYASNGAASSTIYVAALILFA